MTTIMLNSDRLAQLMALPWTIVVTREDGELVARVAEFPGTTATGATEKDLNIDLWKSLEATLRAMLAHGDPITLPNSARVIL